MYLKHLDRIWNGIVDALESKSLIFDLPNCGAYISINGHCTHMRGPNGEDLFQPCDARQVKAYTVGMAMPRILVADGAVRDYSWSATTQDFNAPTITLIPTLNSLRFFARSNEEVDWRKIIQDLLVDNGWSVDSAQSLLRRAIPSTAPYVITKCLWSKLHAFGKVKQLESEYGLTANGLYIQANGQPIVVAYLSQFSGCATILNRASPSIGGANPPVSPGTRLQPNTFPKDVGIVDYLLNGAALDGAAPPANIPVPVRGRKPIEPDMYVVLHDPDYDWTNADLDILCSVIGSEFFQAIKSDETVTPIGNDATHNNTPLSAVPSLIRYRTHAFLIVMGRDCPHVAARVQTYVFKERWADILDKFEASRVDAFVSRDGYTEACGLTFAQKIEVPGMPRNRDWGSRAATYVLGSGSRKTLATSEYNDTALLFRNCFETSPVVTTSVATFVENSSRVGSVLTADLNITEIMSISCQSYQILLAPALLCRHSTRLIGTALKEFHTTQVWGKNSQLPRVDGYTVSRHTSLEVLCLDRAYEVNTAVASVYNIHRQNYLKSEVTRLGQAPTWWSDAYTGNNAYFRSFICFGTFEALAVKYQKLLKDHVVTPMTSADMVALVVDKEWQDGQTLEFVEPIVLATEKDGAVTCVTVEEEDSSKFTAAARKFGWAWVLVWGNGVANGAVVPDVAFVFEEGALVKSPLTSTKSFTDPVAPAAANPAATVIQLYYDRNGAITPGCIPVIDVRNDLTVGLFLIADGNNHNVLRNKLTNFKGGIRRTKLLCSDPIDQPAPGAGFGVKVKPFGKWLKPQETKAPGPGHGHGIDGANIDGALPSAPVDPNPMSIAPANVTRAPEGEGSQRPAASPPQVVIN
jgi:hypothetical protein